jgi:alpha-glucosidase
MLSKLDQMGFKNVAIIDPGIKVEKDYSAYEDGLKNDMFLKYPDGKSGADKCGRVGASLPITQNLGREFGGGIFSSTILKMDSMVIWCDMNEPASWAEGKIRTT